MSYQKKNSFEKRQKDSKQLLEKYSDRIPCIVERASNSRLKDVEKNKFLIPRYLTFNQFSNVIRKRIKLQKEEALFLFICEEIPSNTENMGSIYEKHKNKDGFLYVTYTGENTYGSF